ncbi:MAG: cache domain-containing protein [Campylobacterota bacterium]|nr:cache domain-containing protein [Campylobacterota bacterium]
MKLSIKSVLIGGFAFVIIFLVSLIIFSSYYSTKQAMVQHSNNIMNTISDFALDKSKTFLKTARDAADLTQRLEAKKVVNSKDHDVMIKYFYEQLQINKQFASIYYANTNGDFIMLSRNKDGYLTKVITSNHLGNRTGIKRQFDTNMDKILSTLTTYDNYDPRVRPWYIEALKQKSLIWTQPYVFFTSLQPGITTASPIYDKKNKIAGVVGVDIEISELSKFISNLKISENSKVFMMDQSLNMIAFPNKEMIHFDENKQTSELVTLFNLGDSVAIDAYNRLKSIYKSEIQSKQFLTFTSKGDITYHSLFLPLKVNNINWIIGMYVPEDDFLGEIKANQQLNITLTIIITIIFLIISYLISKAIINPIEKLQNMAHQLKELNLNIPSLKSTYFIEINEAIEASNKMKDSLKEAYTDTLFRLAIASEYKDTDTAEHIKRIGYYSIAIGKKLNLKQNQLYILEHASAMHDIGKLAIDDNILLKPGKLTTQERAEMEKHSRFGADILANPTSEIMKEARDISLYHHEKWDGTGYPSKIKGEEIPLNARIVAIADVFDALVSKRCYKDSMEPQKAKDIILKSSGTHFDPKCIKAFNESFDEIVEIHTKYKD